MIVRNIAFMAVGILLAGQGDAWGQFKGGKGGKGDAGRYGWLPSIEAGRSEARRTGKPMMVVLRCVP